MNNKKKILIIDGYGFVFRAYYVQPKLTSPTGIPVGAIYGFTSMLLKLLNDFQDVAYGVVVFDTGGKNFRHQIYPAYKSHRPPVPEDLLPQFPLVRLAAKSLNFATLEQDGVEADDVIASLATKAKTENLEAVIISSDKDLMQLLAEGVKIYDPIKAKYITEEDVKKKFGVSPEKIRDILSLMGDSSDNIPGIAGVGPKTALELIEQFGNFHDIFTGIEQIKSPRIKKLVTESKDNALLSFELTGLDHNISIEQDLNSFRITKPEPQIIANFLHEYGFKSLIKRVENLFNISMAEEQPLQQITEKEVEVITISNPPQLELLYNKAVKVGIIGFYLLQTPNKDLAIIITVAEQTYSINFASNNIVAADLFSYNAQAENDSLWFLQSISKLLSDLSVKKITYDLKSLLKFCEKNQLPLPCACEDLELMHYTISAGLKQENPFEKHDASIIDEQRINIACKVVSNFINQYQLMTTNLLTEKALSLYKDIDLPLCYLLHKIEQEGVRIELGKLQILSREFGIELQSLEIEIFALAGQEFNIGSPKQLGEILFNKMQLPYGKTSAKSGGFSTGADILEKLSRDGHKIADLLLKWRALSKLKNTYTDALPSYINPTSGRIHTTFLQTSTTTGRLSSQEPNLQNIPIRSLEGNKIREVFIARDGYKLISADYSQIELRILSAIAGVKALQEAFAKGVDIHSMIAMQIFDLEKDYLTAEHRRKAKAINFGIIYGISAFGLAKQLNISNSEAAEYINKYFVKFPGIREYMEETKSYAAKYSYVKNLLGRKCYVPQINDKNHVLRQLAERAAINAPIQGMNAEIIKIAMLNLDRKFQELALKTKIILQVHDELLFEAPTEEIEQVMPLIKDIMENAYIMAIPLIVDIKFGNNWLEIH